MHSSYEQMADELYCKIWFDFQHDHQDTNILLEQLQQLFPWDVKVLRLDYWSIDQAVLFYYGLAFNETLMILMERYSIYPLIKTIDHENIFDLLLNHLGYNHCRRNIVGVEWFISFLDKKDVPLPPHLLPPNKETPNSERASISIEESSVLDENSIKKTIKTYDLKKFSFNELIILQARIVAATIWKFETQSPPSQTDIVDDPHFRAQIENLYALGGKDLADKEMRTEWISDMDPRPNKPGRPKNNS